MSNTRRLSRIFAPLMLAMLMVLAFAAVTYADDEITIGEESVDESSFVTEEAKNGILLEDGNYYYYLDGEIQKAIKFEYDGKTYFAKADGTLARNEKLKIDGEYYFAEEDCSLAINKVFTNEKGTKYYADEQGVVVYEAALIDDNGVNRVTNDYGQIKDKQFIVSNGKTYYVDNDGHYLEGIFTYSNGHKYYADPEGVVAIVAQWITSNGKNYFVQNGGIIATSARIYFGGQYSWVDSTGAFETNTFVYVNLAEQILYFYKSGIRELCTRIISGKLSTPTPTGVFKVTGKARNINLTGSSGSDRWNNHVDYWIAFVGSSIGFHDASWRSSSEFNNSSRYKYNGSHGCVNMRYADVKKLYDNITVGTRVVVAK
ncbi:MAG: L,D-transpeptidase family protein [Clostridiales bacterium]|nr:L,D-transpeptidase family protein [Candidatus Crickella merdequi]